MNQLITVDASDFGLEESKAREIRNAFQPMLDKMVEMEDEFNAIVALEINEDTCRLAKDLRLKYVKVRTGTAKIHSEMKAFYLAGGRFVDGWKNSQTFASNGKEQKLMEIEKFYENIEKERIEKICLDREAQLSKFGLENIPKGVMSAMDEDAFQLFLNGARITHENKIKAEKEAAELEVKKELQAKLLSERKELLIPFWNQLNECNKSIDYSELSQRDFDILLSGVKRDFEIYMKEQDSIRIENDRLKNEAQKRIKEDEARKAKDMAERQAYELKVKAEREKLESELKAKEDEARKAKEYEKEQKEIELRKGDDDKVKDLINDLRLLQKKYVFESESNKKMYINACLLLDKVANYINEKTA